MNTIELVKCLSSNPLTRPNFRGVFPCNHLPQKILKPGFVIANTDVASKSGTHWVCFYFPEYGPAEYFDSFGVEPLNKHFLKFLSRNCTSYISNTKRLQGDFSTTCGHYCCVYAYSRCKGKHMKAFLNRFSDSNFDVNDDKIINMYTACFNTKRKNRKGRSQYGGLFICNQSCKSRVKRKQQNVC